jgi:hypothetical protein
MNQKGIAPLIIVALAAIVAVAVGLGIYAMRGGGGGGASGGGNIAEASSLQFKADTTIQGVSGTYTFKAKNIGTSNMMMRIEGTYQGQNVVMIINGALQKLWMYGNGQWMDLSTYYSEYENTWITTFQGYLSQLGGWTGGDWSYTDNSTGLNIRLYNIVVNPSLSDSLFVHT